MVDYLSEHTGVEMDAADNKALTALQGADVVDDHVSTDIDKPLSANQGKVIWDQGQTNFSNSVQKGGTQTVSGAKTFTATQTFSGGFNVPTGNVGKQVDKPAADDELANRVYVVDYVAAAIAAISGGYEKVEEVLTTDDIATMASVPLVDGKLMKVVLHAFDTADTKLHSVEVLISAIDATDSYIIPYAEMISDTSLFSIAGINDGTNLKIDVTALEDITVLGQIIVIL